MLCRSITLVLVLAVILSLTSIASGHISGWKMVHGDVLQVFPEQHKILMKINGEQTILVLALCIEHEYRLFSVNLH